MKTIRTIINADDFGISDYVNKCIEDCIKKGLISSTTILVNGPSFESAIAFAKENPQVSYGLHLNLIEFSPLTKENNNVFKKYNIIDANGDFIEGAIFEVDRIGEDLKKAIFSEWDAQIKKFLSVGLSISHIDSHQHVHAIFELWDVVDSLMEKYNIKRVRRKSSPSIRIMIHNKLAKTPVAKFPNKGPIKKKKNILYRRFLIFKLKYLSYRWNNFFHKKYNTTNFFCSYSSLVHNLNFYEKRFSRNDVVELMCHPGHKSYDFETEYLKNEVLKTHLNLVLINYSQI